MRLLFTMLIILLASTLAPVRAQNADEPPVSFRFGSLASPFSFAGAFEGEYQVLPGSVRLNFSTAKIYLRDNAQYKGRRELAFINVGLIGYDSNGKTTILSRGRAVPVGKIMSPGDAYLPDRLQFSIPITESIDLAQCWLVVEMGAIELDLEEKDKTSYAFAQSDRDIFSRRLAEASKK